MSAKAHIPSLLPVWLVFAVAFGMQVILSRLNLYAPDLLAVFIFYAALTRGTMAATGWGAAAGLASDTLSGGIYGVQAFVGSALGYGLARVSRVMVTDTLPVRALLLLSAALLRPLGDWALQHLFRGSAPNLSAAGLLSTALATPLAGLAAMEAIRRLERYMERRRYGR